MKYLHIGIVFVVCMLFFTDCKKDTGNIGLDIQPDDELLNTDYFDTTTVTAHAAIHDSILTSNVSVNMLGYLDDPVFGKTWAGIYTQCRLSAPSVDFGENPSADSIVLTLVYAGYYGDTTNTFKLNVYELSEDMNKSERYFTNSSLSKGNLLTENSNLYISPRPTTRQDSASDACYLSIRLKKELADRFISQSGGSVYANNASFLSYFKGLYLEAETGSGNGCLVSLNMTHALSKLTVYYHNNSENSLKYSFVLNDSTAHFGDFRHDYTSAEQNLREQLNGNNTSANEILYAQAGAGIKTVLHFPNLKEMFRNQKVVIHRASLIISLKDNAQRDYLPPTALHLTYTYTETGAGMWLPDYVYDYFGGKKEYEKYIFNITQYIQGLIDGRWDDYPLNLMVNPPGTYFSRLTMYGTQPLSSTDFDKRIRLKINYTVVK
jgi:hypothetical protein